MTGGLLKDCCLDGCGCNFGNEYGISPGAPPHGVRGGALDWTKSRKVSMCAYTYVCVYIYIYMCVCVCVHVCVCACMCVSHGVHGDALDWTESRKVFV